MSLDQLELAESAYKRAIIFRPDLNGGHLGLALLEARRGHVQGARQYCQVAERQSGQAREAKMISAQLDFYHRDFAGASKQYEQLLADQRQGGGGYPGCIRFLSALGYLRAQTSDSSQAAQMLNEARELDLAELQFAPVNPQLLYGLSATLAAAGEILPALDALSRAAAEGWTDNYALSVDPRFDRIRNTKTLQSIQDNMREKVQKMANVLSAAQIAE